MYPARLAGQFRREAPGGAPNNGMHPTRDTNLFIFPHRLGRAGGAGR
jgi:hypothetical protein